MVQYCDLGPLDKAIAQGRFGGDLASIYLCLMDIAAGMTYLHSLGIVHRHVCPLMQPPAWVTCSLVIKYVPSAPQTSIPPSRAPRDCVVVCPQAVAHLL